MSSFIFTFTVIFLSITVVTLTTGIPIKCNNDQFIDETLNCFNCHFLCSSCKSFGINVIENECICNSNVYKNETSIYCISECPRILSDSSSIECVKASEFNFQNITEAFSPLQTANDAKWLFLIAAILACCCFCCAG